MRYVYFLTLLSQKNDIYIWNIQVYLTFVVKNMESMENVAGRQFIFGNNVCTEAFGLLKKDTLASYYAAEYQFTIGKIVSNNHDYNSFHITLDDLNEEGMKVYDIIQEKIQKGEWEKEILKDNTIEEVRSGRWVRNEEHPAYDRVRKQQKEYMKGMRGCICTWRNMKCNFSIDDEFYVTPIIIMYTDDWVYTRPGKLYKFPGKM